MAVSENPQPESEYQISFRDRASRIQRLAAADDTLPCWPALLNVLLGTAAPLSWGGREVLWPLWADEAMHRAHCMMHLTLRRERRVMQQGNRAAWSASCLAMAIALADTLAELRIVDDLEFLPCSRLLGETAVGLVSLFSVPDCEFDVRIVLEAISMAAYKRRALILATGALVTQIVMSAFDRGGRPVISIKLSGQGSGQWCLAVATEGAAYMNEDASETDDIVDGLADLLEAGTVHRLRRMHEFVAEIHFPGPTQSAPSVEAATALPYSSSV